MRVSAKPSALVWIACIGLAITAVAFYGIGRFLLGLIQGGQLDWLGWGIVAVAALVPFVLAVVFGNMMSAAMVSFDDKGVYRRTLKGARFVPWASVKSLTIDSRRVEVHTSEGLILFFPLALDASAFAPSMQWLEQKAEALASRDT